MHETMADFLGWLEAEDRTGSVPSYDLGLRVFSGWLASAGLDPLRVSLDDLQRYQRWLAEDYRQPNGRRLKKSTQQTRLVPMVSYYAYLARNGILAANPAAKFRLPSIPKRTTLRDYLELQEATALVQSQAAYALRFGAGTFKRAEEERNLAMLCLAIASGRRRATLLGLKTADLDVERRELRVAREKGRAGRVLPLAGWAVEVCRLYRDGSRARLLAGRRERGYLFPGSMGDTVAPCSFYGVLQRIHSRAAEENPDLENLAAKHISPHGLRVTCATLLFKGGCDIRSINELLLHENLSTTARYTPIPMEDLRRAVRLAHPRA